MATAASARVSPGEFFALPDRPRYELVDGRLVEMGAGLDSSRIGVFVHFLLETDARETRVGSAWAADTTIR